MNWDLRGNEYFVRKYIGIARIAMIRVLMGTGLLPEWLKSQNRGQTGNNSAPINMETIPCCKKLCSIDNRWLVKFLPSTIR